MSPISDKLFQKVNIELILGFSQNKENFTEKGEFYSIIMQNLSNILPLFSTPT